ncbi:MAG TPA: protease pro-enzyme activation domain-containing protein [Solirubrobacteraceae bacterium]|jgi:kumamolisin|nr:protease pro-enzyme activation domain-containing protein [Solirubrobacteraceae bacterium]
MSKRFHLRGSSRTTTESVGAVDSGERLTVTVYVQRDPQGTPAPAAHELGRLAPRARTYLRPEEAVAAFGAAQSDLEAVAAFAQAHGLRVVEASIAKRLVRVSGTAAQMNEAFAVKLGRYEHPQGGTYRSYEGEVQLPAELAGVVEGVLGLDNRRMVRTRPHVSKRAAEAQAGSSEPPANAYTPPMLAKLFDFPTGDGAGQCVAVLAFNGEGTKGGYEASALEGYFTGTLDQPAPTITDVVVQGPGNDPGNGSEESDATGEVLLDLCTVGGVVPGADVAVYFTEFTEEGWVNAIKAVVADTTNKPKVLSCSYGNPENEPKGAWTEQAIKLVNGAFEQAATQGITICCASGDEGSADEPGTSTPHVDFPASSPWVLGCGGIRLEADPATGTISSEVVWNDLANNEGATGGGVSVLFPVPEWQAAAGVPSNADGSGKPGRGVPDVASLADPETPMWVLSPGGQLGGVGGTSASAPMWSALITLLNQLGGTPLGFCNPQLYAHLKDSLVDITEGNNGSYKAGPGWDACTGWGRPDGARLLQALKPAVPAPEAAAGGAPATGEAAAEPSPAPPKPAPSVTPPVPGLTQNLVGPEGQLFADPHPGGDESAFQVDNTSDAYYKSPYYKEHEEQLQPLPAPRVSPPRMQLSSVMGDGPLAPCVTAKRICFHAVGDTGPSETSRIKDEASVADAMAAELNAAAAGPAAAEGKAPAFLFHLGDVVYNFGEHQYYYDQFYEPFRAYDAPIFAIPGNHDGFPSEEPENQESLFAFLRNFCVATPGPSPDSGGLVRTAMNQPGAYFTLDAPWVSIVGLYSNVLEGPGVISSEGGRYEKIGEQQLEFLIAELARLKPQREAGERAVILACHHPPLSVDEKHGGARGLAEDIDKACAAAGLRPDAVLSGHAHLYQRYTRTVEGAEIPYIVSGSGGHNVTKPNANAAEATPPEGYAVTVQPIMEYGYLTLTVDMSGDPPTLAIVFNATSGQTGAADRVTIDLAHRRIVAGA